MGDAAALSAAMEVRERIPLRNDSCKEMGLFEENTGRDRGVGQNMGIVAQNIGALFSAL